jgi:type IV pilus assembly protein PilY1
MDLTELSISCPDATTLGTGSYTLAATNTQSNCEKAGGLWSCKQSQLSTGSRSNVTLSSDDKKTVPNHRYFGYHSYGGGLRKFRDSAGALTFDKMRVTDTPGFNCGTDSAGKPLPCSLVDVTVPEAAYATFTTSTGKTVKYVPIAKMNTLARGTTEGPGWFVQYNNLQERTAAGSTVIAGVVAWPTFAPASAGGVAACSLSGSGDLTNLWQADAITGLPDQSEGYRMYNDKGELIGYSSYKSRPTNTPPGDPGSVVSVGPGGRKYGWMTPPGPGEEPSIEANRTEGNDVPDIYWLEVPRNLHVCRHENSALCNQ